MAHTLPCQAGKKHVVHAQVPTDPKSLRLRLLTPPALAVEAAYLSRSATTQGVDAVALLMRPCVDSLLDIETDVGSRAT